MKFINKYIPGYIPIKHIIIFKKLYLSDPKTLIDEESKKLPCRRFFQAGSCQFAGNCKYSHYTHEQLWELKQQSKQVHLPIKQLRIHKQHYGFSVELAEYEKRKRQLEKPDIPSFESWLTKYNEKHNKKGDSNVVAVSWTYPELLETRSDLPPSMKKFKPEDFVDEDFAEWGS